MSTLIKNLHLNDAVLTSEDLGVVYTPKGSITVAATASALSAGQAGWVYNMSDSGTIADGIGGQPFNVKAGDNIVIIEEDDSAAETVKHWDKLSATIATYTGTGAIVITQVPTGANTIGVNVGSNIAEVEAGGTTAIEVSLDKAAGLEAGQNLDNKTIGEIVAYLGGTVSAN